MARTARNRVQETPVEQKTFQVGIYARLSVEGDERKNESIDTQIEIAKHYMAKHPEMTLFDVYTDLGATGTNFEREGFERMMQDIRRRNINCVIVKDLSRFGRNCVETGNYIQKIFPFMNVRFIAVSDSIDTFDPDMIPDELTVNIKNLVNELYAKDIAKKVKASKQAQIENGNFLGGFAPYGYHYEWHGKVRTLVTDPETAGIVKDIYQLFMDGKNMKQIAHILYERKVHRPSVMHSGGNVYQQDGETLQEWSRGAIKEILTNPAYIGCLMQATTCGKKYRFRDRHDIETDDFQVHWNTHEAIISEEDFFRVAQKFEKMSVYSNHNGFQKTVPVDEDIYQDVMVCGDCGKKMRRTTHVKTLGSGDKIRWYGYRCDNTDKLEIQCPAKGISKLKMDELVLAALEKEFKLSSIRPGKLIEECKEVYESQISVLEKEKKRIEMEILSQNKKLSELYMQYRMGQISANEYQNKKKELEYKADVFRESVEHYDNRIRNIVTGSEEKNNFLIALMKCRKKKIILTRDLIRELIKRIDVYSDYRVKIQFSFHMSELMEREMINCCKI